MAKRFTLVAVAIFLVAPSNGIAAASSVSAPDSVDTPAYAQLLQVAERLGMVRGMQRTWRSINRVNFAGQGDCLLGEVVKGSCFIEMNYVADAARIESDDQPIAVFAEGKRWQESKPGVPVEGVEVLSSPPPLALILTPHGVIRAALEAETSNPGSVSHRTLGDGNEEFQFQDGVRSIVVSIDEGMPVSIVVTAEGEMTEVVLDEYTDWELLDVLFPKIFRITRKGGEQIDLAVTSFRTNPYVIFPLPAKE